MIDTPLAAVLRHSRQMVPPLLEGNKKVEGVLFVCYTREMHDAYQALVQSNKPA
jgi:hypothetical protein